jgi:type I restriction enzyme, S subunit
MSDLPSGWIAAAFGQLFDFKGGSQPPKVTFSTHPAPGYVRLLQIRDFESDTKAVFIKDNPRWPKCSAEDIMIGRYGASVGKVLSGKSGAYNVALVKMIFEREFFDASWVRLLLLSDYFQAPLKRISRSAQNGFNKADLEEINVPLPPLPEQRRIVAKIDSLSAKSKRTRDHLDHIPRLGEKYKQAILAAAFRGELTQEWRATRSDRRSWRHTTIGEIAQVASGHTPKGIEDALRPDAELHWFKVSSMNEPQNQANLVCSQFRLSREAAQTLGLRIFPVGTIVFPKRGGAIATNKKRLLGIEGALDLNLMALVPHAVRPDFLWWWVQGLDLSTISDGSNVPQINHGDIVPLEIELPDDDEQDEIARRVSLAFAWINRLVAEATSARKLIDHLDQAFLAKAFRGQLVPQDPADEPASKLLERIRAERSSSSGPSRKRSRQIARRPTSAPERPATA